MHELFCVSLDCFLPFMLRTQAVVASLHPTTGKTSSFTGYSLFHSLHCCNLLHCVYVDSEFYCPSCRFSLSRLSQSRSHGFLVWCGSFRSFARPSRSALKSSTCEQVYSLSCYTCGAGLGMIDTHRHQQFCFAGCPQNTLL